MLFTLFNVIYVLIAVAMIALILLQRGAGAAAGSGFGGGASATVFGARGAANFLSRSTAVLAGLFFLLSLAMGMYLHPVATKTDNDLGVMSGYQTPAAPTPANTDVPATTTAPTTGTDKPAPTNATPASDVPAPSAAAPAPTTPAPAIGNDKPAPPAAQPATDKKSDTKKKGGKPADKDSH